MHAIAHQKSIRDFIRHRSVVMLNWFHRMKFILYREICHWNGLKLNCECEKGRNMFISMCLVLVENSIFRHQKLIILCMSWFLCGKHTGDPWLFLKNMSNVNCTPNFIRPMLATDKFNQIYWNWVLPRVSDWSRNGLALFFPLRTHHRCY